MKKRKMLTKTLCVVLSAVLLASGLTGCGGGGGEAAGTGEQTQKDTLIIAKSEDVTSLDPSEAINLKSTSVYSQMYEGLVRYNPETKEVEPCLATEWTQVDDNTWRFTLREGVSFHDGNTMTSEDVVFSFERVMNSGVASLYVNYIESLETDGDYGVIFHLKTPYAQIIQALTYPAAVVVSKAAVEKEGENYAQSPVGTGPYRFVERQAASSITLEAFDGYWGEKAKTQNLIFQIVPEGSQRTIMLENGEVDVICDVLPNDASRIEEASNLALVSEIGYKYYSVTFKPNSSTPVGNKLVRQAIEYAIDKQSLVDAVMYGYGQVGSLMATPPTAGYNAEKDRGNLYDPEKAKELLTEAGYPNGFDLDFYVTSGQTYEEIGTILQDQLKEVGINLNMNVLESNTIDEMVYGGQEVPIRLNFYNNICGETEFVMQKLLPDAYGQVYFNDEMVDLINRARSATDPAEQQAAYNDFFDLMAEDVPQICLFYEQILVGMQSSVQGFQFDPMGIHRYAGVTVYE